MSDVFISYARPNREIAAKLADDLTSQGYDVWWDTRLVGTDDYHHVLLEQLNKAKAVIVIWSQASVKSRFVIDESERALNQNKLISTCLPDFDLTSLPLGFGGRHTDCIDKRAKIYEALKRFSVNIEPRRSQPTPIPSFNRKYNDFNEVILPIENIAFAEQSLLRENMELFSDWDGDYQSLEYRTLIKLAENRDPNAMYQIAKRYHRGHGLQQNDVEAIHWYKKATKNGHKSRDSIHNYASMFDDGCGVERNRERASFWLYASLEAKSALSLKQMLNNAEKWSNAFRRELQLRLQSSGQYTGPIDGTFGPKTIAAIKALAGKESDVLY